jgi:hypothetical protein
MTSNTNSRAVLLLPTVLKMWMFMFTEELINFLTIIEKFN